MITGIWHGKIGRQKVEIKIIQNGDSLTGSSYYYESALRYCRYSIKGYFNGNGNNVVWWDDQLIDDKINGSNIFPKSKPALSVADFNCPGGGIMKLDGETYANKEKTDPDGEVHLDKVGTPSFNDEWDFVIENYTLGANDPDIIDSISLLAKESTLIRKPDETSAADKTETVLVPGTKNEEAVPKDSLEIKKNVVPAPVITQENKITQTVRYAETKITAPTIEQKFTGREKVFTKEIPITGDSIELRFYDNAEVDGDSISLFLNGKLIFEHIRLTEKAYVVKLSVNDLPEDNELIMVAENLGSIPPNTSYMVAQVGDKRYDAQLASTENSSAMIRLKKPASHKL